RCPPPGIRNGGGGAGDQAVRRAETADCHRAGLPPKPPDPPVGRSHLQSGQRIGDVRPAGTEKPDEGPNHPDHRPSPVHGGGSRSDPRPRGGTHHRQRNPRGIDGLPPPVPAAGGAAAAKRPHPVTAETPAKRAGASFLCQAVYNASEERRFFVLTLCGGKALDEKPSPFARAYLPAVSTFVQFLGQFLGKGEE